MNKAGKYCRSARPKLKPGITVLVAPLFLFSACVQQKPQPGTEKLATLPLPRAVAVLAANTDKALEGRVEIPQLQRKIPLQIENGIASVQLSGLTPGSYTVRLVFEIADTTFGRFVVAETEREIDISTGSNSLGFRKDDYHYPDQDGDNYTNLVELKYATDPDTPRDKPVTARMFITSASGSGDLSSWPDAGGRSGIAAGDAICQAHADAAALGGRFVAWLSDENHDAYCRAHGLNGKKSENCGRDSLPAHAGPWVRTDGFPFSPTIDKLTGDGIVYGPVTLNEFAENIIWGRGAPAAPRIWTGTGANGELSVDQGQILSCDGWRSADTGVHGMAGILLSGSHAWTDRVRSTCNELGHLICFELSEGVPLPLFRSAGKSVFVTSVSGTGDLSSWPDSDGKTGIAAGDAICRNRAKAGGLANPQRFKAWLSDSTTDAIDRLVSDGPWVRPDGVLVAQSRSDLAGGVFSSISVDEYGTYFTEFPEYNNGDTWTGTNGSGRGGGVRHCNNWTNADPEEVGAAGTAIMALEHWASELASVPDSAFELACSSSLRLFCFED